MGDYARKKAVITGGSTGIGLATARALLAGGAEVVLTGRTESTLEAAREELGPRAYAVRSDASSVADVDALGALVEQRLGAVDFVFINAGVARITPLEGATEASYDETFDVNTKGAFFLARRLAPLVREGGSFVLNTSAAGAKGVPGQTIYAASKAALRSFARGLAAELLPRGVRVNAVSPGPVATPIRDKFGLSADELEHFDRAVIEITPMKRIARPEEVARAVLFLAFDATFTTGAELPVDGGITQL